LQLLADKLKEARKEKQKLAEESKPKAEVKFPVAIDYESLDPFFFAPQICNYRSQPISPVAILHYDLQQHKKF
jgi:hypothetical protein